jgi:hypothetical protein
MTGSNRLIPAVNGEQADFGREHPRYRRGRTSLCGGMVTRAAGGAVPLSTNNGLPRLNRRRTEDRLQTTSLRCATQINFSAVQTHFSAVRTVSTGASLAPRDHEMSDGIGRGENITR